MGLNKYCYTVCALPLDQAHLRRFFIHRTWSSTSLERDRRFLRPGCYKRIVIDILILLDSQHFTKQIGDKKSTY